MNQRQAPIGVMDSGVGGISVLRILRQELPRENFIFYGDSLHAPYGEKEDDEIRALTEQSLLILMERGVKAVVIACNTATSAAAEYLRKKYPELIILGMEPAVRPAVLLPESMHPAVLVMATLFTLQGSRMKNLVELYDQDADIYSLPAPGIVRLVEAGKEAGPEMDAYLREILAPYRRNDQGEIACPVDSLVLGCTHFPFARDSIARVMGYPVTFYDGACGTSHQTRRRLEEAGLLTDSTVPGTLELLNSDPASVPLARRLLELP